MLRAWDAALSALGAFGKKLDVTAHNLANVNTNGFKKSRVSLQEANPSGVLVSITKDYTPGSPIPAENGSGEMAESSNVALDEEIINLKLTKHAYNANLKSIEAEDEMVGTLLDSIG